MCAGGCVTSDCRQLLKLGVCLLSSYTIKITSQQELRVGLYIAKMYSFFFVRKILRLFEVFPMVITNSDTTIWVCHLLTFKHVISFVEKLSGMRTFVLVF